ncbi:MAG: hypothetical protein ACM30E_08230 [Nitrososphaerales archaeon]
MSVTLGPVLDKTREMEYLLKTRFDATGGDLNACLDSIPGVLPPRLVKKIRHVATIQDRLVHERGYGYSGDENDFWWLCDAILSELASDEPSATASAPLEGPDPPDPPVEAVDRGRLAAAIPAPDRPAEAPAGRSVLSRIGASLSALAARAIQRATHRERGFIETAVVAIALLATVLLLLITFSSLRSDLAPRADPTPGVGKGVTAPIVTVTADAPRPTATPTAPAPTVTPPGSPAAGAAACTVQWQEYGGDALAGKNRNQVWNGVVKKQVDGSGMTAAKFYASVVDQNPALASDGYVFKKGKSYLLPKCK